MTSSKTRTCSSALPWRQIRATPFEEEEQSSSQPSQNGATPPFAQFRGRRTTAPPKPEAEAKADPVQDLAESLSRDLAKSRQESEQAIRTIVANLQNRPHVIITERGWLPIVLAFLLGLAVVSMLWIFAILPLLNGEYSPQALPEVQVEQPVVRTGTGETPQERQARIMREYEQAAERLGLRR